MKCKILFSLLGFVLFTAFWQTTAAKKLNIVTTLPSLASIAENVGGDYVKIYSITRGVQDAHYILKLNQVIW